MLIPTLPTKPLQRLLQLIQVLPILPARTAGLDNMLRQRLRVLRAQELRVRGESDVHETFDPGRQGLRVDFRGRVDGLEGRCHVLIRRWWWLGDGRVERGVLDAISVDLADIEVFFHFGHAGGGNAVCGAPDARWGAGVLVCESFP